MKEISYLVPVFGGTVGDVLDIIYLFYERYGQGYYSMGYWFQVLTYENGTIWDVSFGTLKHCGFNSDSEE